MYMAKGIFSVFIFPMDGTERKDFIEFDASSLDCNFYMRPLDHAADIELLERKNAELIALNERLVQCIGKDLLDENERLQAEVQQLRALNASLLSKRDSHQSSFPSEAVLMEAMDQVPEPAPSMTLPAQKSVLERVKIFLEAYGDFMEVEVSSLLDVVHRDQLVIPEEGMNFPGKNHSPWLSDSDPRVQFLTETRRTFDLTEDISSYFWFRHLANLLKIVSPRHLPYLDQDSVVYVLMCVTHSLACIRELALKVWSFLMEHPEISRSIQEFPNDWSQRLEPWGVMHHPDVLLIVSRLGSR